MSATGADGKRYQMSCIPVSQLNEWLFAINANKVAAHVKENLLTYQRRAHARGAEITGRANEGAFS